jgi:hypothetical protein
LAGFTRDPTEITAIAGIEASKTWRAGDPIERSVRKYDGNGWRVSALVPVTVVEEGVAELLDRLRPHWAKLCELSVESRVELGVVIYADSEMPSIHFRSDQIQRLAELSAKIDVDVYCLPSE